MLVRAQVGVIDSLFRVMLLTCLVRVSTASTALYSRHPQYGHHIPDPLTAVAFTVVLDSAHPLTCPAFHAEAKFASSVFIFV